MSRRVVVELTFENRSGTVPFFAMQVLRALAEASVELDGISVVEYEDTP